MSRYGMMCGLDDAIKYLSECKPRSKSDDMPLQIIERLKYIRDKEIGVRPKFHKGVYGRRYDSWTCGHCGTTIKQGVVGNFCGNCGFRILWDSCRCLTGRDDKDDESNVG